MSDIETELIVIRHGQSEYNAKLTDNLNSNLTEKGIEQAIATGKYLKQNIPNIHEFYGITSPYLRCLQTSDYINREIGNSFTVESAVREAMMEYEECRVEKKHFPHFSWKNWTESHEIYRTETESELVSRIWNLLKSLSHPKLILVSHASPVAVIHDLACGLSHEECVENVTILENERKYVRNCSIAHVRNGQTISYDKVVY